MLWERPMARKSPKTAEFYTVRNEGGQYFGTYRAMTAQDAIARAVRDLAVTASTFRKSQPMPRGLDKLTAKVEG